ncbi:MAG: oxidoreductase [Rhizobiales bacterium]|nr:oxidoreductase [Hyphomicrobiales bacterium]MBA67899.1 oxidoreductase [Hyphomicrobiales bacterium]
MNVLVLGATGFIGSAIALHLADCGHRVTGLGRSVGRARARHPAIEWVAADLAGMRAAGDWKSLLDGCDVVVNCAGALQDGLSDDLAAVQETAQIAMQTAARQAGVAMIVQISAATTGAASHTAFLATKRRADENLAASGVRHVILRPALVIGRNAFGATALIRALAAFPVVSPLVHAGSPVSLVTLDDVARAVEAALAGDIPSGSDLTLAHPDPLTLGELVKLHTVWLGLPPRQTVELPAWSAALTGIVADCLGKLGWRSPLRSTAMAVMREGVVDDPDIARRNVENPSAFLARNPAGLQDIWAARLYLLKALIFGVLALFWIVSGLIPLFDVAGAASRFAPVLDAGAAQALTIATCFLDIALGALILLRPAARMALLGTIAVSFAYMFGSVVIEPAIWLDPLGPMVKVFPAILVSLAALALLEER